MVEDVTLAAQAGAVRPKIAQQHTFVPGVTGEAGERYRVGHGEPYIEWGAGLDAQQGRHEE